MKVEASSRTTGIPGDLKDRDVWGLRGLPSVVHVGDPLFREATL